MKEISIKKQLVIILVLVLILVCFYNFNISKSCAENIKIQEEVYLNDRLLNSENFNKYKTEVYYGPLKMLNLEKNSESIKRFSAVINEELEKTEINFAGKYSIVSVGVTGWGRNYLIVDRSNGEAFLIPFRMVFFLSQKDSSLLIVNPKISLANENIDLCFNTGLINEFYTDLRPYYYVWNGDKFNSLGNPAPESTFWE